eukprot:6878551-Pyramimonas_sp.AAC.1
MGIICVANSQNWGKASLTSAPLALLRGRLSVGVSRELADEGRCASRGPRCERMPFPELNFAPVVRRTPLPLRRVLSRPASPCRIHRMLGALQRG